MIDISFKPREYFHEIGLNEFLQKELGLETKNISFENGIIRFTEKNNSKINTYKLQKPLT